jgi:electron transfer flavoprotein beta subunit
MNIIVCAKQVIDVSEIKIDSSSNKPILTGVPVKISDIDKNAMEEAIKIKDKHGGKITTITVGPPTAKEKIKELLAMGADEAVIIPTTDDLDYYITSKLLSAAIQKIGEYDLIICGEASIDLFSGQIAPRIAGELQIPQITYVQQLTAEKDKITAERNLGDTAITIDSPYPLIISVTKEINEPRLPSLMQILASANKPINEWKKEDLLQTITQPMIVRLDIKGVSMQRKNVLYQDDLEESIKNLVNDLANEGVLGG